MATTHRARLTPLAGRRFGVTMAVMLTLIATLAWWREAPRALAVFLGLAAAFALAALLAPSVLVPIERAWLRFGEWLGAHITTPVLFTLFWWIAFVPIGIVRRTFGRSPVRRDPQAKSYWIERPAQAADVARAGLERQF